MIPKSNHIPKNKTLFLGSAKSKNQLFHRKFSSSSIKIWRISAKNSAQPYHRNKTYQLMQQSPSISLTTILTVRTKNASLYVRIPRLQQPLRSLSTRAHPHSPQRSAEMRRERSSHLTCLGSSIPCRHQVHLPKPAVPAAVALPQVVGAQPVSRAQTQEYSRKPENLRVNIMESLYKSTLAYAKARMLWNSIAWISTPSS